MSRLASLLRENDPLLQALRVGGHTFPGIWQYMMPPEFTGLKFPRESRATCMNCPKACYDSYRPDYRCCTYHPRVPNFLLGLALETEQGQTSVRALVDRGMLLPEGMHYAPAQWVDYLEDLQNETFGQSQKVLCPHLEPKTGFCMIHAFRNSVCSTFFCYKDHGDLGDQFWGQVQTLGSQVEMALCQWSLFEIGFDLEAYFQAFDRLAPQILKVSGQGGWTEEALAVLWGKWFGRELELLRACAEAIVSQRDQLWELANTFPIFESQAFDRALIRSVPRRLKDQVDPEDQNLEAGEAARPRELWLSCMKTYHKLWDLPEGTFELSPRAEIVENAKATPEELYYQEKPYCLLYYLRKSSKTVEWRLYLSAEERKLLLSFQEKAQELDWELFSSPAYRALDKAKEFVAHMITQKVLIARQYH
jgi:hypothetical protein